MEKRNESACSTKGNAGQRPGGRVRRVPAVAALLAGLLLVLLSVALAAPNTALGVQDHDLLLPVGDMPAEEESGFKLVPVDDPAGEEGLLSAQDDSDQRTVEQVILYGVAKRDEEIDIYRFGLTVDDARHTYEEVLYRYPELGDVSGVKISDTKFSGNHAASCTSSKPDSNLSKNSSISSAGFLQPTLE